MTQHRLPFGNNWGGRRKGAGRKPKGERALNPRSRRPDFQADQPVHVTLRIAEGLPSLRRPLAFEAVESALAGANAKGLVRVVHFSVQSNHVHLIVEAKGQHWLTRGMQGLCIRMARALNRCWERTGKVFGDRYHARALKSARQVRNAIRYVLNNFLHHGGWHTDLDRHQTDRYSSGHLFDGWRGRERCHVWRKDRKEEEQRAGGRLSSLVPNTWLLRTGWRRWGAIGPSESPA